MAQGGGVGGDEAGQCGTVLGVLRAGQEGSQLVGEVPGRIDQCPPLLPAFPPAVVGRVGPEHEQQAHDEAEQRVDGNRAVEVEVLAVMQLHPRQGEGVHRKGEQHPDHLAERVAPMELENEGKPGPRVVEDHRPAKMRRTVRPSSARACKIHGPGPTGPDTVRPVVSIHRTEASGEDA